MATGTGNLPYPGKSYTPFDILTAEELNEDVANIESLATGTGIGDSAIPELKTIIKSSYSTSEVDTGVKWVDGKSIYKKTINFGGLPNNTTKVVAHGVTGISNVIDFNGISYNGTVYIPIQYPSTSLIFTYVNATNVEITTTSNRTTYTVTYVTIWYTK